MGRVRFSRSPRARLAQLVVAGVVASAGVLAFGAGSAFANGSYACTGVAAIDTPGLQGDINTGGTVTVFGPKPCVGNWTVPVSVTIVGGSPGATLNGNATGSVLTTAATVTLTVRNLKITNGAAADGAGVFDNFCGSVVNLQNALVTGNTASVDGGGVEVDCGTLNATASTISNNTADHGGGIYVDGCGATINVTNSTVANNTAVFNGGGIDVFCSTVNLTGATFSHNTVTDGSGGGLDVLDGSTLIATASSIISNTASGDGGGINANDSFVTLTSTSLNWNTAAFYGGGIEFGDPFGCTICAPTNAAAPAAAHGPQPSTARPQHHAAVVRPQLPVVVFEGLDLESSTVEHNTAQSGAGGGIDNYACESDSPVVINNSTVAFNRATGSELDTDSGGGGYAQYGTDCGGPTTASLVATNSQFGGNTANSSVGGGIFNYGDGANTTLQPGSHVIHNQAFVNGGGVFNDCEATLTVVPGAIIAFNTPNQVFTNPGPCLLDD